MKPNRFTLSMAVAAFSLAGAQCALAFAAPTEAELLDRVAIEQLVATYLYRLDHGESDKLSEMYTDDGVLHMEYLGDIKGHAAIDAYYAKRTRTRTTRHVATNFHITFSGRDHAHMVHTFLYFMGEGKGPFPAAPSGVADYDYDLVRASDGRWLIQNRKSTPIFGGPPPRTTQP